jgi:hypothetical protein
MRRIRGLIPDLLRAIAVTLAAMLLAACGNNPDADNQTLFQALTANTWCNEPKGSSMFPPDTSKTYAFMADGNYRWSHFSDYPEGSGKGTWNWQLATTTSGVILLSEGDALSFSVESERKLLLETMELNACEALGEIKGKTAKDLPHVETSNLFKRLTANTWESTSELVAYRVPISIAYKTNGEYEATFEDGCRFRSTWSLRDTKLFRFVPERSSCGSGSPNGGFMGSDIEFRGPYLLDGWAFFTPRPRDQAKNVTYFYFNSGLSGQVSYSGHLESGQAKALSVTVENRGKAERALTSIKIISQPVISTRTSIQLTGGATILATTDLTGVRLAPGSSHMFSIEVTPAGSGEVGIRLELAEPSRRPEASLPPLVADLRPAATKR